MSDGQNNLEIYCRINLLLTLYNKIPISSMKKVPSNSLKIDKFAFSCGFD
jgi:hypothetical protein